ncbi:hypothetical protein J8J42_05585 [Chryseobacterium sp. cx-311]|uniref:hypothetical protein n=1 Tax=Marnyiella aurantia TaxID=2758037 RepID=UPI001AE99E93|nr:hypothetical protein [Marnyiella aurantia]MBP0612514.1 hypothetical protein [Marnyiella aurantia]
MATNRTGANIDAELLIGEIAQNADLLTQIRNPQTNPDGSIEYLTSKSLEYMLSFIDYKDQVDLAQVNYIISEVVKIDQIGAAAVIANTNLSAGAKVIANDMLNIDREFETLAEYAEYASLNSSEKMILETSWEMGELARQGPYSQSEVGWSAVLAATIVGGSIGGVWGAAIGFAVVGVIALAVKM